MVAVFPNTWRPYLQLARMDKPIGSLLLLWPTLWALWLAADGHPSWFLFVIFVAGVFVMRSAGCVINDFADRDFDGHVKRTLNRPLPSGRVTPNGALVFFGILVGIAFILVCQLNWLAISLSVIGLFLAAIYPFMKRMTSVPQLILGFAFSWSIPMAYAAVAGNLSVISWLLFLANILWTIAYDTQYAMVDRDDDLRIGLKSTAILFGLNDRRNIALLQAGTLVILLLVGALAHLTLSYYMSLAAAVLLFLYQQWLIRHRQRENCFKAFLNNNWVGALIFVGILFAY